MGVGRHPRLILQHVAAVEELADVTTDMEVDQKLTAWVVGSETLHIENYVIENAQLLPAANPVVKVLPSHDVINLSERLLLFLINLEKHFECNNESKEDNCFKDD